MRIHADPDPQPGRETFCPESKVNNGHMCLLLPGEPAAEGGHGRGGAGQEQAIRGHCQQVLYWFLQQKKYALMANILYYFALISV